jgi:enoyl-CoA hydratase
VIVGQVRYDVVDRVGFLVIDRPEKRNALSRQVLDAIAEVLDAAAQDESLCAVALTGAGDRSFASGGDLVALASLRTPESARDMALHARSVLDRLRRFPLPVVAALNGDALGGGAELALACDFRVLAAHARMGFVQARQNITTAWGGGVDLIRLLGPIVGLRLLMSAELISGPEGLRHGLYDRVADPEQPLQDLVNAFLEPLRRQQPQVLRSYKAMGIAHRMGGDRDRLETMELEQFVANWVHDDHWKALDQFLNRGRP